jgi:hypothetical protein
MERLEEIHQVFSLVVVDRGNILCSNYSEYTKFILRLHGTQTCSLKYIILIRSDFYGGNVTVYRILENFIKY